MDGRHHNRPAKVTHNAIVAFRWLDQTVRAPHVNGSYSSWGAGQPDNLLGAELCAAANRTLASKTNKTWGWSDEICGVRLAYICEVSRPNTATYYSLATENNYLVNTSMVDSFEAAESCHRKGGFTTSYL
jgi:hypothetical protein